MDAYAKQRRVLHGQFTEVGMGTGFCMLITRELIDRIGGLTDEVDRMFFEDEDFSMRAQQAGYHCVVAEASYVWHAEHQSVRTVPEREAIFTRNRRWCEERWGRWVRIAWPRFEPVVPGSDDLRQWLEQLVRWARRRTYVYVFCPTPPGMSMRSLFRSVGLTPHVDVEWHSIPKALAPLAAGGLIMKRRKKRFDIIVTPTPRWGQRLSTLQWLHRATVVPAEDEEQLTSQWQQKSRSLS